MTMGLLLLPFVILWALAKVLPPWTDGEAGASPQEAA
jgi:hypothetical protein